MPDHVRLAPHLLLVVMLFVSACAEKEKEPAQSSSGATGGKNSEERGALASKEAEALAAAEHARPSWIRGDTSGKANCQVVTTGLSCVGVASNDDKDVARLQALLLALDEAAIITARAVQAEADGRPWADDDASEVSDDAKVRARKAIDATLGITPSVPPHHDNLYWEEFLDSPRFKVFAEKKIGVEERKHIAKSLLLAN